MKRMTYALIAGAAAFALLHPQSSFATDESPFEGKVLVSDAPDALVLQVGRYSGMSAAPSTELEIFGDGRVRITHRRHTREAPVARVETMRVPSKEVQELVETIARSGVLDTTTAELRRQQDTAATARRPKRFLSSDLGGYMLRLHAAWYQRTPEGDGVSNLDHQIFVRAPHYFADRFSDDPQFEKLRACFAHLDALFEDERLTPLADVEAATESR